MPWSPLKYREQIFQLLRRRGMEKECTIIELERAIIETIGVVRPETIRNIAYTLAKIGDIEEKGSNIWLIRYWDKK